MKRRLLLLTEEQHNFLWRELVDVGMGDGATPSEIRMANALTKLFKESPTITDIQWHAYQNAAGELLEAGADHAHEHLGHTGVRAAYAFEEAMRKLLPMKVGAK